MTNNQQAAREWHPAFAYLDRIEEIIRAMKGRPLSAKQRAAVFGVLLNLPHPTPPDSGEK